VERKENKGDEEMKVKIRKFSKWFMFTRL